MKTISRKTNTNRKNTEILKENNNKNYKEKNQKLF